LTNSTCELDGEAMRTQLVASIDSKSKIAPARRRVVGRHVGDARFDRRPARTDPRRGGAQQIAEDNEAERLRS